MSGQALRPGTLRHGELGTIDVTVNLDIAECCLRGDKCSAVRRHAAEGDGVRSRQLACSDRIVLHYVGVVVSGRRYDRVDGREGACRAAIERKTFS